MESIYIPSQPASNNSTKNSTKNLVVKSVEKVDPSNQMKMMNLARKQATFNIEELTVLIFGSKKAVDQHNAAFARVEKALGTDDNSKLPSSYAKTGREDQYLEGLKAGKIALEDGMRYNHQIFDTSTQNWVLSNASPFGVQTWLFTPFAKGQMTDELLAYWIPLAESGKILGVYAQTELGHGTYVGGIETTATFDRKTDEIIIHSPTLSSAKYWPGSLGYTSSHAAVMARLIVDGKDLGVHAFMVQLRSLGDFKSQPGVELGDIGSKMGYNGNDNGYAIFNHVRIPRGDMLMRHATLARDGTYTKVVDREKLLYDGMLKGRGVIIRHCAFQLAQALTIATRYSVVREQGRGSFSTGNEEMAVIQYGSQRYRLFTLISFAYANLFAWKTVNASYQAMLKSGDMKSLPYNHNLTCGMKAWATQSCADGAEDARKMCGGHGYMNISGLPAISTAAAAACTFEGENWVMWQQLASYLIKGMDASPLPFDLEYLSSKHVSQKLFQSSTSGAEFLRHYVQLRIFQHRAARLVRQAAASLASSQLSKSGAWNKYMMILISATRAHCDVHIITSFMTQLSGIKAGPVRDVLSRLLSLFALTSIVSPSANNAISFIEDGYLSNAQLNTMRDLIERLLDELMPDAIALTDAWNFTDASLASAIGCKDGDAYERIMCWTRQLPLNVEAKNNGGVFAVGHEKYVKPFMSAKL